MSSKISNKKNDRYRFFRIKIFIFLILISIINKPVYASGQEMIINKIYIFIVLLLSSLYLKKIYNPDKLFVLYKKYIKSLKQIIELNKKDNKDYLKNSKKILDESSYNGFIFLIHLLRFLMPYFICFSILSISKLTTNITLETILPSIPYLLLFIRK